MIFTGCLLSQGQIVLYDLDDAASIEQHKWYAKFNHHTKSYYAMATIRIDGKRTGVFMHRFLIGLGPGNIDKRQVDHINHNTLDNRKINLRIATNRQNGQNKRVKGYNWDKFHKKWSARICVDGKRIRLGWFNRRTRARRAYLDARIKYGFINDSP